MPGQAATINSMHTCPMTTGNTPHVGGPVVQGENSVLIGGQPATTASCICTYYEIGRASCRERV